MKFEKYLLLWVPSWISCIIFKATSAALLNDWRNRTIYQILTDRFALSDGSSDASCDVVDGRYCGGSWKGIEDKLDYIQGMNFDALWISPIVAQLPQSTLDGEAYTAYWAQDLYALNPKFGTADNLQSLIRAVHAGGMYLMLDVVVNHLGYAGPGWDVNYSNFNPFNETKYFHNYCPIGNILNQTNAENCWLGSDNVALADLRTEDHNVREMLGEWISSLVSDYSIDGLRLDTAVNVEPEFFPGFLESAGVFATGEVMSGNESHVCPWAETIGSILNYPLYYPLTRAFASVEGSINDLVTAIYTMRKQCGDPTAFGLFSENHDVNRFASMTKDISQAKNIIAYTIMGDGIPIIYQGQEQHMDGVTSPCTNRAPLWWTEYSTESELYHHLTTLNKARKHFIHTSRNYTSLEAEVIYQDYHSVAMRKGIDGAQVITVLNNNGEGTNDFDLYIEGHGLASETDVIEILTCTEMTVNGTGCLTIPMGQGKPKVIYPKHLLEKSGLCGYSEEPPSATTTATRLSTPTGDSTMSATPSHTKLPLGASDRAGVHATILMITVALSFLSNCHGTA